MSVGVSYRIKASPIIKHRWYRDIFLFFFSFFFKLFIRVICQSLVYIFLIYRAIQNKGYTSFALYI